MQTASAPLVLIVSKSAHALQSQLDHSPISLFMQRLPRGLKSSAKGFEIVRVSFACTQSANSLADLCICSLSISRAAHLVWSAVCAVGGVCSMGQGLTWGKRRVGAGSSAKPEIVSSVSEYTQLAYLLTLSLLYLRSGSSRASSTH